MIHEHLNTVEEVQVDLRRRSLHLGPLGRNCMQHYYLVVRRRRMIADTHIAVVGRMPSFSCSRELCLSQGISLNGQPIAHMSAIFAVYSSENFIYFASR